jgi:hypothetical protein
MISASRRRTVPASVRAKSVWRGLCDIIMHGISSTASSAGAPSRACARNVAFSVRAASNGAVHGALKYTAFTSSATVNGSPAMASSTKFVICPAVAFATHALMGAAPLSGEAHAAKRSESRLSYDSRTEARAHSELATDSVTPGSAEALALSARSVAAPGALARSARSTAANADDTPLSGVAPAPAMACARAAHTRERAQRRAQQHETRQSVRVLCVALCGHETAGGARTRADAMESGEMKTLSPRLASAVRRDSSSAPKPCARAQALRQRHSAQSAQELFVRERGPWTRVSRARGAPIARLRALARSPAPPWGQLQREPAPPRRARAAARLPRTRRRRRAAALRRRRRSRRHGARWRRRRALLRSRAGPPARRGRPGARRAVASRTRAACAAASARRQEFDLSVNQLRTGDSEVPFVASLAAWRSHVRRHVPPPPLPACRQRAAAQAARRG